MALDRNPKGNPNCCNWNKICANIFDKYFFIFKKHLASIVLIKSGMSFKNFLVKTDVKNNIINKNLLY